MILEKFTKVKKQFDVHDPQHVEMFRMFMQYEKWGTSGCPFELEYPYLTVPDMIKDKIVRKYLNLQNAGLFKKQ
jgi:hypothetical protein